MKKAVTLAVVVCLGAFGSYMVYHEAQEYKAAEAAAAEAALPDWYETDSSKAIARRTAADFSLSRLEILEAIQRQHPEVTDADLDTFVARHYIESMNIDGEERFHRKSPRNLNLLNPEYASKESRGDAATQNRYAYVDSVLSFYRGKNDKGLSHRVKYRFSVDVPGHELYTGDSLRVWMPLPLGNPDGGRQRNVSIISSQPQEYILSDGRSVHNTIYFTAAAPAPGDTAHFEYVGELETSGRYFPVGEMASAIKPYDKSSDIYRRYTSFESPHIVRLDSLAHAIVGNETDPIKQSELVYDYIDSQFPWAGAREYSTIPCIPQYVLTERHGDCGQVSLLYISLMRTLGVPARWESGWMLHPGETNLHDWTEVYFEGIGWVPVDTSFGRYKGAEDPEIVNFYSHGIDAHRFASNTGVCGPLYPAKKFVRSETVDFQVGEVETTKANLFYPAWSSDLEIISIEPVTVEAKK